MVFIGKIYRINDGQLGDDVVFVCYEKKAHIHYGCDVDAEGDLAGMAWSVGPCDGSCVPKEEAVFDEIVADLAAFLEDGQERSGTTLPPHRRYGARTSDEGLEQEPMAQDESPAIVLPTRPRRRRDSDDYDDESS